MTNTLEETNFCNLCGHPVNIAVPEGDNRLRHICTNCGHIQYQNPRIISGCIITWEDRLLLCRRSIEPRYGKWTFPAGFLENGETLEGGAARESQEEALAKITAPEFYLTYNIPKVNQVHCIFRAELLAENAFGVGEESLEVDLFTAAEINWNELAFLVIKDALTQFLADREQNHFPKQLKDIHF